MSAPESPFRAPPIKQCAIVVRDLDEAVRRWVGELGIGPWTGYRLEAPRLKEMRYRGEEAEFSLRHALAWQGDMQFELVQPLDGPSPRLSPPASRLCRVPVGSAPKVMGPSSTSSVRGCR